MGKGMYVYYLFSICSRGTTDALQKIPFAEKACKIVYRISSYQEDFVYLYFVLISKYLKVLFVWLFFMGAIQLWIIIMSYSNDVITN